jgi:hypothetical protein
MKSKSLGASHTRVTSYRELDAFVDAFAKGHLNLLIVYGRPGVGKSSIVRKRVGKHAFTINGTASPFGIYLAAYRHRDEPIVLDDIDGLTASPQGVRLLKALSQTDPEKTVSWETQAAALDREEVPRSFQTRSQLCILANSRFVSEDARALEDRGHVLVFDPSALEVHQQAAHWFRDQQVFEFVANHLHLLSQHSFRTYVNAAERKQAGLPWQSAVLDRCLSGLALEVAKLRADPQFACEEERARAFIERGLGCRATYFNHARRLRPQEGTPRIELENYWPTDLAPSPELVDDVPKRRHMLTVQA